MTIMHRQVIECTVKTINDLEIVGGMSETVFPKAEVMLEELEYQRAIAHLSRNCGYMNYQSFMDFILCEIFIEFKPYCRAYYKDEGPCLSELVDRDVLDAYDEVLSSLVLQAALELYKGSTICSWTKLRGFVRRTLGINSQNKLLIT